MLNKLDMIVSKLEKVPKLLLLISVSQVMIFVERQTTTCPRFIPSGEEKPQPFIPLDIDKQGDGSMNISNHINLSPPNGRLPMSVSGQLSSPESGNFHLDGGVYQGQPMSAQSSDWNTNTKVRRSSARKLISNILENYLDDVFTIIDSTTTRIRSDL